MEEQEMPILKGHPFAFSSHTKRRNNSGAKFKGKAGPKGGRKDDVIIAIKRVTMQGSALIKVTHTGTIIKISLKAIKGMAGQVAKVKEVLEIKEQDNHSRRQEIPSMNLTLLTISKMNIIYQ